MAKKIGLVLSGGGAKGYAHIAILKLLDELNIKPDIVAGTSMGAIIGAAYCCGMSGIEIEQEMYGFDIKKYADLVVPRNGLLKGDKLLNFFRDFFSYKRFEETDIPILINAVDIESGKEVVFSKGDLGLAVRASMSIPGVLAPVEIRGHCLIDGGVLNNIPISLIKDKCDIIITSNVNYPLPIQSISLEARQVKDDGKTIPLIVKTIMKSIYYLETNKKIVEFAEMNSDVFFSPMLSGYTSMDFRKAREILNIAENDVKKIRSKIIKICSNGK